MTQSELLKILLENCKKRNSKGMISQNLFLAETFRFIVLRGELQFSNPKTVLEAVGDELSSIKKLLQSKDINLYYTQKNLSDIVETESISYIEFFLFNKMLRELELQAEKDNLEQVTAEMLVNKILEDPPKAYLDAVVPYVKGDGVTEKPATAGSAAEPKKQDEAHSDDPFEEDDDVEIDEILKFLKADDDEGSDKSKKGASRSGKEKENKTLFDLIDDAEKIRKKLSAKIFGQDYAITTFVSAYFQSALTALMEKKRSKPRAVFVFVGPPGVGKTYLSEQAAEALKLPFMRFDMSEYSDKEAPIEFCGSDKVYKNGKEGNVTSFVAKNPHSVLLFDEIEKAHPNIINLFLQMLDAGRLRDNFTDEEVSFVDTIIIFTTNAGKNLYEDDSVNLLTVPKNAVVKALRTDVNPVTGNPFFTGAICSRFASGNIVMFNHMSAHNLLTISANAMEAQRKSLTKSTSYNVEIDEHVYYALLYSEGAKADARTIKSKSINFFHQELYELIRLLNSDREKYNTDNLKTIKFEVELPTDKELLKFFTSGKKPAILAFGREEFIDKCKELIVKTKVIGTSNVDEVASIIKTNNIGGIICDFTYGAQGGKTVLNIDDISSTGSEFLRFAVERYSQPIYLYCGERGSISEEEYVSLLQSGARGVVYLEKSKEYNIDKFFYAEAEKLHRQACLTELARANKALSFRTLQRVSDDGSEATIALFDFQKKISIDAGDAQGMLDNISKPDVRFADVIGAKDAKDELAYFIEYLKAPDEFARLGVKAPKGILLYGPPGTGKTMLAKAVAGESDVTFITAEGNQFLKSLVGAGAESVHRLFRTARKYAPSILFIDEIDAIAKNRQGGTGAESASDVLTAFLTEMDGFNKDDSKPVFVLAATNYGVEKDDPRGLDPALLRRFDRRIYIDLPNKDERIEYINLKISKIPNHSLSSSQVENIAMRSTGASLAELESIFELAMRNLIKSKTGSLTDEILEEAFETFNSGEVKSWSEKELLRTARHEAGHALVCRYGGEKPSYLTIVARGNHGGYMQHENSEDKGVYTKRDLVSRVRTALAGRACETIYYGEEDGVSTGAGQDLRSATGLIEAMICDYGMDKEFGLATLSNVASTAYYEKVMDRVRAILEQEFEMTKAIIQLNKEVIDKLVDALLKKDALKSNEIEEILKDIKFL